LTQFAIPAFAQSRMNAAQHCRRSTFRHCHISAFLYVVLPVRRSSGAPHAQHLRAANPKGGSGKSAVAILLAGEFSNHGYFVAIADADRHGSAY